MKLHVDHQISRRIAAETKLERLRDLKLPFSLTYDQISTIASKGLSKDHVVTA